MFALLVFVAVFAHSPVNRTEKWESPFQAGGLQTVPPGAKALGKADCIQDQFNECTFEAKVDFDGDGKLDRAFLANFSGRGIIAVDLGNPRRRRIVAASFPRPFRGDSFIRPKRGNRRVIEFVQPEVSMAEIKLIGGKPMIRWLGD